MKNVTILIFGIIILTIVAFIFFLDKPETSQIIVKARTAQLRIYLPEGYSNNPNDTNRDANLIISFGKRGVDYRQISIENDDTVHLNSILDYQNNYVKEGEIFDRCVTEGAGVSNYCTKILNTALIRDDDIKVYRYELERVRDVYLNETDRPQRTITTHVTFDVLLPSFELITIHSHTGIGDEATADAEYISRNIKLKDSKK